MSIQWGRVLLAAFLMEVVLIAIAVPLFLSGAGRLLVYVVPLAALIGTFAITVWIGRRINSKFVLHGVLIGIVGTLIYCRPHPRATGTMAILGRACVEGSRRRGWRNCPGTATGRREQSDVGRLINVSLLPELIIARKIATICL